MGLAISVLFVALGANLVWGVQYTIAGFRLAELGWISILAGVVGAVLSVAAEVRNRPQTEVTKRRRPGEP
jgi:hypothetical protein